MRLEFLPHKQNKFIQTAIEKVGNGKELGRLTNISADTIYSYRDEKFTISLEKAQRIAKIMNVKWEDVERDIKNKLPDNWGQKLGGKKLIKLKTSRGIFPETVERLRKASSERMKEWHKEMKEKHPKEYHIIQYNRFKKVGNYKFKTKRGEKVRNELERDVANFLFDLKVDYEYETLVKGKRNYYFPDFLIGNIILECSMWRGEEKARKLKNKIRDLEADGFEVFVIIPENIRKFYKLLEEKIITNIDNLRAVLA